VIRVVVIEKAKAGALKHRDNGSAVTVAEIESVLGDLRKLTEAGLG